MASLIPSHPLGQRIVYEFIHLCRPGMLAFNMGFAPPEPDILDDPASRREARQIQLYAELLRLFPYTDDAWRQTSVLEIASAAGGGLRYLHKRYRPAEAIGIEISRVASRRGRRLGLDIRQGDARTLPFENARFDCVLCVDALSHFPQHAFVTEIKRVLRPDGRVLLAQGMPGPPDRARDYFEGLAAATGMAVESFSDLSHGARLSVRFTAQETARHPLAAFVKWFPASLRARFRDTLNLPGSERYELWQSGAFCLGAPILRHR